MWRRAIVLGFAVALLSLAAAPAPVAAQELAVDDVSIPDSVTAGEEFDIEVDVTAEDVTDVDVALALPEPLTCSPTGSQSVSIEGGSGTATFSCEASAPGDYSGNVDVTATGETTDGDPIDDTARTGIVVTSPASLSVTTGLGSASIDEGDSTTLTVSVTNAGDVSTSYDLSVSPGSGLSAAVDSGSPSGSIDGGDTVFVTYVLTGTAPGDHDATVALTGGNGQELEAAEPVTVDSVGGGGGGGGSGAAGAAAGPTVIDDPASAEGVDPPADVEVRRLERASIVADAETGRSQVEFTAESAVERITFDGDLEGEVTVAEYDAEPETAGPPPGVSVSVTEITVPDPDRGATIRKRVPTSRLDERGIEAEDLRINRFAEGEWRRLDTELVGTTDERVVLEAETPGFSLFSVTAASQPTPDIDAPDEVAAGESFTLDGSGSADEYGEIVAYRWAVDGETDTGETVTASVADPGEVDVELTVENDAGETATATATVSVRDPDAGGTATDAAPPETTGATEDQDGFGVAVALLALLTAALVAARRS